MNTSSVMAPSSIQFQKGLSLPSFERLYGTEEQCETAMEKTRWPDGFRCPGCNGHEHGLAYGRHDHAGHQTAADTWFLAFYLIGQAKTGNSSIESCPL